jgi:hypothetical protein
MGMEKLKLRELGLKAGESQTRHALQRRMGHSVGSWPELSMKFTLAGGVRRGGRPYEEKRSGCSTESYFAPSTRYKSDKFG